MSTPGPGPARPAGTGPRGPAARLTAGWKETGRAATLREHAERYGPLPDPRGGRAGRAGLIEAVAAAGLTGRGGAGFPTGTKMRAVASRRGPAVVVANGVEAEPASQKDQALLGRAAHLILDGIVLAAEAVGADRAHLCLARTRGQLADTMLTAAGEREHAGQDRIPIAVHQVPDHYVSSEETSLVRWLNGGEAKPALIPPRPSQRGVRQRPTLINNVETLAHIALIARYGPAWFRQAGSADAPGTMLATVTGAVADPGVYEIEAGTCTGEILAMAGMRADSPAVLLGGYFGTWHAVSDVAGLPFTSAGLRPAGAAPGAGVLFALPPGCCGLAEAARVLGYLASQGARQCGPCMFGLPAIADDLAQLAGCRPAGDPLGRLQRRFAQITGRGACRHPDGAVRMASSALAAFAADAHAHASRRRCLAGRRGHQPAGVLPIPRTRAEGEWR